MYSENNSAAVYVPSLAFIVLYFSFLSQVIASSLVQRGTAYDVKPSQTYLLPTTCSIFNRIVGF